MRQSLPASRGARRAMSVGETPLLISTTMAGRISSWSTGICIPKWTLCIRPSGILNRSCCFGTNATAGDLVQLGEVTSGGSYLSQNDLRIHFGLGGHERLDHAEVQWPDGYKETLTNLPANRFYLVRDGVGSSPRHFPCGGPS